MADFSIKQYDTKPVFSAVLRDPSGNPVDLSTATSVEFRLRKSNERAHVVAAASIDVDPTTGRVSYAWADGDTDLVGDGMEAVIVVTWNDGSEQTFPTVGYVSVDVKDNIEAENADLDEVVVVPDTTPQTYGTGDWPWTPTVLNSSDEPVVGASVRVITSSGTTYGPATTGADGKCLSSDGFGSFRLSAGSYTLQVISAEVTYTQKLTIDASGNGVIR